MYVNIDGLGQVFEGAQFESAQHFQAIRCVIIIRLSDIELSLDYGRAPAVRGQWRASVGRTCTHGTGPYSPHRVVSPSKYKYEITSYEFVCTTFSHDNKRYLSC